MERLSSKSYQKSIRESGAGFTLIELVVVLGLFMMIMGVTVSIFISIVQHQKRILGQQEMLNQVSFLQEYTSRLLREVAVDPAGTCLVQDGTAYPGYAYLLTRFDAASGFHQGVKFLSKEGVCQELFLDADGIVKEMKNNAVAQDLLSGKFTVHYARFVLNGNKNTRAALGSGGAVVPRITMAMSVQDPSYENSQAMIIQTTISKR